jgi:organic radical activating enzyme
MKIYNIRHGFATNSSSNHSIVFFPKKHHHQDDDVNHGFHWNYFTATSKKAKLHYLAANVIDYVSQMFGIKYGNSPENERIKDELIKSVVTTLINPKSVGLNEFIVNVDESIDHQSKIDLPVEWDGGFLDLDYLKDLKEYLLQDEVVIFGGNDNDNKGYSDLDPDGIINIWLPINTSFSNELVARKEQEGNYWVLFNRSTGSKVRFSFNNPSGKFKPTKASVPELIDIKITDYCDKGCAFCYQNSSVKGKHAKNLHYLANVLRKLKVFEVAIGGGEPTTHPEFIDFLSNLRAYGIIPNFTTKSLSWLKDPDQYEPIMKVIGGFAYSVMSAEDVDEFANTIKEAGIENGYYHHVASVQYVVGSTTQEEYEKILDKIYDHNLSITLLGFKKVGRGVSFNPYDYKNWLNIILYMQNNLNKFFKVGIDTALAAEFETEIIESGISKHLFETSEGGFSMYIDAVTGMCGPSSYCKQEKMKQVARKAQYGEGLSWEEKDIKDMFSSF